tara:strand:- start:170 stop:388 length:219 start_codon:yes stop_codon:yes gene_type:complete
MTQDIDRRDYGKLEAQVEQLTKDVHELKTTVQTMSALMQNAVGGWKMLLLIGGAGASFGAFISWALTHISIK